MVRSWTWLGLCWGLTSTALAESSVPRAQISVPAEIPSGGVLPMFGTCLDARCSSLESVVITDNANGTSVEGNVELEQTANYQRWGYFVPSVPLRSGATYSVTLTGGYPGFKTMFTVSAADSTGLVESALRVTDALTKVREVRDQRCCSAFSCIDVSVLHGVALSATFSAERPIATQYLYELSMHAQGEAPSSVALPFYPLISPQQMSSSTVTFDGAADSYCYTVRARPIVGGEPFTLLTRCLDNDYTGLGREQRTPEEMTQWAAKCEATTADGGARPLHEADAAVDADGEPLGRGDGRTLGSDDSGCQLANSKASMAWGIALLALTLAKRRRAQ